MSSFLDTSVIYSRLGECFALGDRVSIAGGATNFRIVAIDMDEGLVRLVTDGDWYGHRDVSVDILRAVMPGYRYFFDSPDAVFRYRPDGSRGQFCREEGSTWATASTPMSRWTSAPETEYTDLSKLPKWVPA